MSYRAVLGALAQHLVRRLGAGWSPRYAVLPAYTCLAGWCRTQRTRGGFDGTPNLAREGAYAFPIQRLNTAQGKYQRSFGFGITSLFATPVLCRGTPALPTFSAFDLPPGPVRGDHTTLNYHLAGDL